MIWGLKDWLWKTDCNLIRTCENLSGRLCDKILLASNQCQFLRREFTVSLRKLRRFQLCAVHFIVLYCNVERGRVHWKEGYKNPPSLAAWQSSLGWAKKKKNWCQKRRFGDTWIWWLRLLSDYSVEKVQVNTADRLEQRRYTVYYSRRKPTVLPGLSFTSAHTALPLLGLPVNQNSFGLIVTLPKFKTICWEKGNKRCWQKAAQLT